MIFADKVIRLRKMNGWSQEELAVKMNVSRQAVSKWESAQTTPDLEKILQLSALFGVTTDYLLKEEMEAEEFADEDSEGLVRIVTLEDAQTYLVNRKKASVRIALATFLCMFAPIWLLLMGALSTTPYSGMTKTFAVICGLCVMLLFITVAVGIYIATGFMSSPFRFVKKYFFETAYGVDGMVREKRNAYRSTYVRSNIIGVCFCVFSPVIFLVGAFTEDVVVISFFLSLAIVIAGIGVFFCITAGVQWKSMQRLLKERD